MGYFKRKLSRDRAGREARDRGEEADASLQRWEAIPDSPPKAICFLRFASRETHPDSRKRKGIFTAAYAALDDPESGHDMVDRLRRDLAWFEVWLPAPEFEEERAVFFFKSSAQDCMHHIWSLLHSLRDAGVWVEMQSFDNPGKVVYEDVHQVAAIPWSDTNVP